MTSLHKLKKALLIACILFLLFFFIRHPETSVNACTLGMKLWLNTLIPTLLPFMILTGILIKTNCIDTIFYPFRHIWKFLFGLSPQGVYAFFIGILCGYPMGAKITSDLYEANKISKREAHYLLTFANNASPAFIINYLYLTCLKKQTTLAEILGILFLSTALCMLFFRLVVFKKQTIHNTEITAMSYTTTDSSKDSTKILSNIQVAPPLSLKKETSTASSFGTIIDVSIMNGFETITRLGGYILLFSLISGVINHYNFFPPVLQLLCSGSAELTTGLHQISCSDMPYSFKYMVSTALTAFGGFSILAQTRSVVSKELSITPYLCAKCMNTLICILLIASRT